MHNTILNKYRDILEYIALKKTVTVTELSSVFFLSESTVRRVLAAMEKENHVVRFHGGASITGDMKGAVGSRRILRLREKAAIGREAASLVTDGMTVILLGGTTVHAICHYLKGRKITVITTSIPVINDLIEEKNVNLILLGGVLNPPELECRGSLTVKGLKDLHADILFISATNIHPVRGIMTDDPESVQAYRASMAAAEKKVLLADSTKFNAGGLSVVAGLDEIDYIISDSSLLPQIRENLIAKEVILKIVEM